MTQINPVSVRIAIMPYDVGQKRTIRLKSKLRFHKQRNKNADHHEIVPE